MAQLAEILPHATASLNALATILLIFGLIQIKKGNSKLHRKVMIACFGVSALFLLLYLLHKVALYQTTGSPNKRFPTDPELSTIRSVYLTILGTHLLLALSVPPLAIAAIWYGIQGYFKKHRKIVRWAFPIWLYVSVTGVVVYWFLYWGYPTPVAAPAIISL